MGRDHNWRGRSWAAVEPLSQVSTASLLPKYPLYLPPSLVPLPCLSRNTDKAADWEIGQSELFYSVFSLVEPPPQDSDHSLHAKSTEDGDQRDSSGRCLSSTTFPKFLECSTWYKSLNCLMPPHRWFCLLITLDSSDSSDCWIVHLEGMLVPEFLFFFDCSQLTLFWLIWWPHHSCLWLGDLLICWNLPLLQPQFGHFSKLKL